MMQQLDFAILNERKFQWDLQGSFFATAIWNEINLRNKYVEASFSSMGKKEEL